MENVKPVTGNLQGRPPFRFNHICIALPSAGVKALVGLTTYYVLGPCFNFNETDAHSDSHDQQSCGKYITIYSRREFFGHTWRRKSIKAGPVLEGGERSGRPRPPNQSRRPLPKYIYKQYSVQNILAQVYIIVSLSRDISLL
jgi:hypothetical protein